MITFQRADGYGQIIYIYLLPEYFGKGYGRQLLQATIDNLRHMGYRNVFLYVLEENVKARHFYEQFGFEASSSYLDDEIGDNMLREIQYVYHTKSY